MKKCIFLPGDVAGSFVVNELEYLKEAFDEVFVLGFIEQEGSFRETIKRYGFRGQLIKNPKLKLTKQLQWNNLSYVKEEKEGPLKAGNPNFKCYLKRWMYLQMYGAYLISATPVIEREIDNFEGDVYLYSFWLSRPAYVASAFSGKVKQCVSRAHGYDLYLYRNATNYLPFRKYIKEHLNKIYFISENGRSYFRKHFQDSDKCEYALSSLGTFDKGMVEKNEESLSIVSCSSVIELKRLDLIIEVIKYLQDNIKGKIRWTHLGDGPLMDDMKKKAVELLEKDSFTFLGNVPNDKVISTYQEVGANFFINMSDTEGVPVSIMEAMSAGLYIIGRRVGGVPEIINEKYGLLIDSVEDGAFFEQIVEFVVDHTTVPSLSARWAWEERYNADKNYREFFGDIKGEE